MEMLGAAQPLPPALGGSLANGVYKTEVPAEALALSDKGYAGVIEEIDDLGKERYLYRVCCGKDRVFIIDGNLHKEGENVFVTVATDKLTFTCNGETAAEAISSVFRLNGKFLRVKEGKEKKHYFETDGVRIETPFGFNRKMYDRGRSVFKRELSLEISADKAELCGEGLPVTVENVLDYGAVKYARLRINEKSFCIPADTLPGQNACVKFDFDAVKVYDSALDMRLF